MGKTVYTRYLRDQIKWLNKTISAVRAIRAEYNVPPGAEIILLTMDESDAAKEHVRVNKDILLRIVKASSMEPVTKAPPNSAQVVLEGLTLVIPLADVIDLEQERARLGKESEKWAAEIKKLESKLGNKDFVDRAPPEIVEEQRERKAEAEAMLAKLQAAQKSLVG